MHLMNHARIPSVNGMLNYTFPLDIGIERAWFHSDNVNEIPFWRSGWEWMS